MVYIQHHLSTFTHYYSHPTLKKWKFKLYCFRQKRDEWLRRYLNGGSALPTKFKRNDSVRQKQLPVGGLVPRLICWGNGSVGHTRGCPPVPNRMLLYKYSRTNPILIIDEFRTSKLCYLCHLPLAADTTVIGRNRYRHCPSCDYMVDRDVNGALNIQSVVMHHLHHHSAPPWQSRSLSFA